MEFKLRPLIVPQDARLEFMVRVEPLDVPESISLTVLGHKTVTWNAQRRGAGTRRCVNDGHRAWPVDSVDNLRRGLRCAAGRSLGWRDTCTKGWHRRVGLPATGGPGVGDDGSAGVTHCVAQDAGPDSSARVAGRVAATGSGWSRQGIDRGRGRPAA